MEQARSSKQTFCGEWINTHDKFLVDEDGFFWYAGRTDDMMKVSGQAGASEVESRFSNRTRRCPKAVVGTADPDGLIKPVAYVVLKDSTPATPELAHELQEFVKRSTSPHKYPRGGVCRRAAEDCHGKIQRFKLRELASIQTPLHRR